MTKERDYSKTGTAVTTGGDTVYINPDKSGTFMIANKKYQRQSISGYLDKIVLSFENGKPEHKIPPQWRLVAYFSGMDAEIGANNPENIVNYAITFNQTGHSLTLLFISRILAIEKNPNWDGWIQFTCKSNKTDSYNVYIDTIPQFNSSPFFWPKNPEGTPGHQGVPLAVLVADLPSGKIFDWTAFENFCLEHAKQLHIRWSDGIPLPFIPEMDTTGYLKMGITKESVQAATLALQPAHTPAPTPPAQAAPQQPATEPSISKEMEYEDFKARIKAKLAIECTKPGADENAIGEMVKLGISKAPVGMPLPEILDTFQSAMEFYWPAKKGGQFYMDGSWTSLSKAATPIDDLPF